MCATSPGFKFAPLFAGIHPCSDSPLQSVAACREFRNRSVPHKWYNENRSPVERADEFKSSSPPCPVKLRRNVAAGMTAQDRLSQVSPSFQCL